MTLQSLRFACNDVCGCVSCGCGRSCCPSQLGCRLGVGSSIRPASHAAVGVICGSCGCRWFDCNRDASHRLTVAAAAFGLDPTSREQLWLLLTLPVSRLWMLCVLLWLERLISAAPSWCAIFSSLEPSLIPPPTVVVDKPTYRPIDALIAHGRDSVALLNRCLLLLTVEQGFNQREPRSQTSAFAVYVRRLCLVVDCTACLVALL